MSYKKFLKAMLRYWPRLFIDEKDVLEHFFFTNGNGLDWKDGELTDNMTNAQRLKQKKESDAFRLSIGSKVCDSIKEIHEDELQYRKDCIDLYAKMSNINNHSCCWFYLPDFSIGKRIYPICQYACVMNLPDDIKLDWLAAAKKAVELAFGDSFKITDSDRVFLLQAQEKIKALEERQKTNEYTGNP